MSGGRAGIIPARAGFTWTRVLPGRGSWDHPRSRGVYMRSPSPPPRPSGSSPLARGLLAAAAFADSDRWIIPARAGFTQSDPKSQSDERDHPRSRGVYSSCRACRAPSSGSSPLARGLPVGSPEPIVERRIIPARAGFTMGSLSTAQAEEDHPRSRGVYRRHIFQDNAPAGSSPLARGLLDQVDHALVRAGIIPARAGFTRAAG